MWRLRAWITRHGNAVTACFVASCATQRAPATRTCATEQEARRWVEDEARFLEAAVEWI